MRFFSGLALVTVRRAIIGRSIARRLYSGDSKTFDPYKVLGLEPGASLNEIRKQYLKLSKKHHPDYNPGDQRAQERFISLQSAYRVLVDKVSHEKEGDRLHESKHICAA